MEEKPRGLPRRPPRMPTVRAKEELDVPDIREVLLAEFSAAPVKEIIDLEGWRESNRKRRRAEAKRPPSPPGRPATIQGKRLVRVLHPTDGVLAQIDPQTNRTPLDFMEGRGDVVVLASVRPGDPYTWQLVGIRQRESPDALSLTVSGAREATPAECEVLDAIYPKWRERCEKFDRDFSSGGERAPLPMAPRPADGPMPDMRVKSRRRASRPHFSPGPRRPPGGG